MPFQNYRESSAGWSGKRDRLDKLVLFQAESTEIGPAPKFALTNQKQRKYFKRNIQGKFMF
jgi:hypothetical protein